LIGADQDQNLFFSVATLSCFQTRSSVSGFLSLTLLRNQIVKQKPSGGGGADFQDVGSQFWDLDFTQWASHDPGSTRLHSV